MAGCRSLSLGEERALLRVARRLKPRDRALVVAQLLTGFRISEVLSLTVGSVYKNGLVVSKIGIAPRHMKGGYGSTRWIPVLPELARALQSLIAYLQKRYILQPDLPLFLSRQDNPDGSARAITRETARQVIKTAFARAGMIDDGRLGTHALRKTFARNVYRNGGNDLMVLKKALNHSSVAVTQRYLEVEEDVVLRAIRRCDRSRTHKVITPVHVEPPTSTAPRPAASPSEKSSSPTPLLEVAEQLDFLGPLTAA